MEVSMTEGPLPPNATPFDAYKAIIDAFVDKTDNYGAHRFVARHGFFSRATSHRQFNDFIATLSRGQVELLAQMLREERYAAVHDVLASLTWWIQCQDVALTYRGEPMPVGVEGGLHNDYVGRLEGWQWPDAPPP
jgi:hypothetical protein